MLKVDDIDLYYGAAQALRGVSLTAGQGQITCVLGRNGVGKTSLMRAIVGQQAIRRGAIGFDGADIAGEAPYRAPLVVAGSFSGMDPAQGTSMDWNAREGRYEGRVLLKQGRHQYFYSTSDPSLAEEMRRTQPRRASTYTAFVYYRDAQYNTDRLLRVGGVRP